MNRFVFCCLLGVFLLCGCETEAEKRERIERVAEQNRLQQLAEARRLAEEKRIAAEKAAELERRERERAEKLRQEREERERRMKLLENELPNGAHPFTRCWGRNRGCDDYSCSEIKIIADRNYDVLVTIKENDSFGDIVRHFYVQAGNSKTVEMSNGRYQPFFTYGKGWDDVATNPIKGCTVKGWFVEQLSPSKDDPVSLYSQSLTYTLQVQVGGNFQTLPSSNAEAF